jgi:hypothetical protein
MARKPRVEFDGAFYHVIVGGNQRQRTIQGSEMIKNFCPDYLSAIARNITHPALAAV